MAVIYITNKSQLEAIGSAAEPLNGNYVLEANLDLTGVTFTAIGTSANPFTGTFNGNGFTISNLTINASSSQYAGMFGVVGTSGVITNVDLVGDNVTGEGSVGALVGYNEGSVIHSYATGVVSGPVYGGPQYVGGLIEYNAGTITESYTAGSATSDNWLGGLAGFNTGSITQSYSTATVNGLNTLGGLVGFNEGSIAQSYATGPVSGYGYEGGLVGSNAGSVTQSYAAGLVDENGLGLIGASSGTVINAYWDVQSTGQSFSSGGGTGLTTAQFKSGLPTGFDSTVWSENSNINNGYPYLLWQFPVKIVTAQLAGTVSELPFATGSNTIDHATPGSVATPGTIVFTDGSLSTTTATVLSGAETVVYTDAHGNVDTSELTAAQIQAFEQAFATQLTTTAAQGTVDWTYSIPDKVLDFLGVGETVTVTAPIQISDGQGNTLTENVVITINGADDNPVAVPDTALAAARTTFTADAAHGVLANDTDPDIHDTLTVSAVDGQSQNVGHAVQGLDGTLTLNSDGSYSYQETAPNPKSGTDVFDYTISDGHGGSATSTLTISFTKDAGPEANPDTASVAVGGALAEDAAQGVLANDTDPDNYAMGVTKVSFGHATVGVTSQLPGIIEGKYGELTLNGDGSYTYNETATSVPAGAQDVFNYTVSDGHGSATTTLTIDIGRVATTATQGIDYRLPEGVTTDPIVSKASDVLNHYYFIGEYIGNSDADSSYLTGAKASSLISANLQIFSIYEKGGATEASYFTYAEGVNDGANAYASAMANGQEAYSNSAIYFAVDFDPGNNQTYLNEIASYFEGIPCSRHDPKILR